MEEVKAEGEWPSIGDIEGIEVEEGGEDINVEDNLSGIPGLAVASESDAKRIEEMPSASSGFDENADDLASLGELRFADPD